MRIRNACLCACVCAEGGMPCACGRSRHRGRAMAASAIACRHALAKRIQTAMPHNKVFTRKLKPA